MKRISQRAQVTDTVLALYPDGCLPRGERSRLRRELAVGRKTMADGVLCARLVAAGQRRASAEREPDESPWLAPVARAFLDGVLAAQGYHITAIEPPPGECL